MRTRAWFWILIAALAVWPAGLEGQTQGRVSGRVLDSSSNPVADVVVTVRSSDGSVEVEQKTNKKGRFTVAVVDATRTYGISLEKEGFQTIREPLDIPTGGSASHTWTLQPGAGAGAGAPAQGEGGAAPAAEGVDLQIEGRGAAVKAYNNGARKYNAGDLDGALELFEQAIAEDPSLEEAYKIAAAIRFQRQEDELALQLADGLLAAEPESGAGLAIRHDALWGLERHDEAADVLSTLLAVDAAPDHAPRAFNVGLMQVRSQNLDDAVTWLEKALELDAGLIPALNLLGRVHLDRQEYDQALARADALLTASPNDANGLSVRLSALRGLGDEAGAQEAFEALKQADPTAVANALYEEGETRFNGGDTKGAIGILQQVIELSPDHPQAHFRLGLAYVSDGQNDLARTHFNRFIELSPDDPEVATAREMLGYLE